MQVETVGKVYMVVGGAPETNETHVKDVAMGEYNTIRPKTILNFRPNDLLTIYAC